MFYDIGIFGVRGPVSLESVPQLGHWDDVPSWLDSGNACLAGKLQKGCGVLLWLHLRPHGVHLPLVDRLNFVPLVSVSGFSTVQVLVFPS